MKKNPARNVHLKKGPSKLLEAINASIDVDQRLYREDIEGSIAHTKMLGLQKIISKKDQTKIISGLKKILKDIEAGKVTFKKELTPEFESFIQDFPFEVFKVMPSAELLEIHSRSKRHWEMFGVLPARLPDPVMPETPDTSEHQFIKSLVEVYQEIDQIDLSFLADIPKKYQKHFKAQRMLFYSAEGLNRFSRDKLPGAFDDLKNQVEVGIGNSLSYPHANGLARLKDVLDTANGLQVTANPLSVRLQAGDLGGTCHHLANQGRIKWVDEDE